MSVRELEVRLRDAGAQAPAVRALDEIHRRAIAARASDVHIEPSGEGGRVRQRVDGILCEAGTLTAELFLQVVSRIKLVAGMDIADRRQPQDGRYVIEVSRRSLDARVSSMPTISGEKIVVRLFDHHARTPSLERIGIDANVLEGFRNRVLAPHGFIVVAGPTGSGKTTTLYAAVMERQIGSENICSVEDPVEIRIPGVSQVQINPRAGVTFASALRGFLRQDPNVILVGEMRDSETAAVAASASLSGQLVLTTLHSNDACSAIDRLAELGVSRKTMAAGLSVVVAQRLLRRLCSACRSFTTGAFYDARGCAECDGTGYAGRCAIFELLFIGEAEREAIARDFSSVALRKVACEQGHRSLQTDALNRLRSGDTSLRELRRVLVSEEIA